MTFNIISNNAQTVLCNTYFPIFHSSLQCWELNFQIPSRNLYFGGCTPSLQLAHAWNPDREHSFLSNHRFLLKILRDQRSIKTITCTFQKKIQLLSKETVLLREKIKRSSAVLCFVLLKTSTKWGNKFDCPLITENLLFRFWVHMAGERQTDVEKNVYFVLKWNTPKNIFWH